MKRIELLAASFALAAVSCVPAMAQAERQERSVQENLWRNLVDTKRAQTVSVVLRVRLLKREGTDKIGWDRVRLVGVIKNSSHFKFPDEFENCALLRRTRRSGRREHRLSRALQRGKREPVEAVRRKWQDRGDAWPTRMPDRGNTLRRARWRFCRPRRD
jgi:hypothetical protein